MTPKKITIITGEDSGDLLGADLARALNELTLSIQINGMGGKRMQEVGVDIFYDAKALAIVGIVEVLKHAPLIFKALASVKRSILDTKPDLLVLIDFPGFNLRLAKFAKKHGIKVLYYVSPQLWAWRYSRINIIKRCVAQMAVFFEFEKVMYEKAGIPAIFVGHPLGKLLEAQLSRSDAIARLGLDPSRPIIGILPGSRRQEIAAMLPTLVDSITQIKVQLPNAQFVLALAPSLDLDLVTPHLNDDIQVVQDDTYTVIPACDAILCVSGTATLEVALFAVPMAIIYKTSALSYAIGKRLIRVPYIGLCNIVAEEKIAPEFIQDNANPDNLSKEIIDILQSPERQAVFEKAYAQMKQKMVGGDPSQSVARWIVNHLKIT